ncbi:cyclin-dependent kinase 8-like [Rhopalosiphum padi]|uniref:cyclin-dependent kinase 8-like n=1 Tax=Rhopalosiphum padi TaxID=40932 RepID=UPI00298EA36A|nr:cyclin-dependent kinase 8-like [Rhopalosiphum padi]
MLPTFAVCFLASTALAACSARTRVHYIRAEDRSRHNDPYYYPERERFQSRASSIFGPSIQTSAAGFPYRFVFPANHPALSGSMYSQFVQNPHQPEPATYSAEDLFGPQPVAKQHPLSDLKHRQHQQQQQQQQQQQNQHQQQQQQIGYESMAKMQYDFLGGGGGGGSGKMQVQQQPSATYHHHLIKQPKHYQSYELAPNALQQPLHQPLHQSHQSPFPSTPAPIGQPIMLLIPSSGQPGAPYQTLVLVPSTGSPSPLSPQVPLFSGFHQQVQHQHGPPGQHFVQQPGGFITTHPRGPPLVAGFPSGLGGGGFGGGLGLAGESVPGLGKFPGAQLFHRSHETLPKHPSHQQHQHQHKASSSRPSLQPTSYQGSGSTHVSHTTAAGSSEQQPLEDKVGQSTGTSGEKSDERNDDGGGGGNGGSDSTETKSEENKSPEFGDKTTVKPLKRIVVT